MVFNQAPGVLSIAQAAQKGIEAAGIKVKSVGFDPQTTDLVGPVTAAGSQTADVLLPVTDVANCINYAKALKSAGLESKPVLSAPLCLAPPVAAGARGPAAVDVRHRAGAADRPVQPDGQGVLRRSRQARREGPRTQATCSPRWRSPTCWRR